MLMTCEPLILDSQQEYKKTPCGIIDRRCTAFFVQTNKECQTIGRTTSTLIPKAFIIR